LGRWPATDAPDRVLLLRLWLLLLWWGSGLLLLLWIGVPAAAMAACSTELVVA
jgi:hypothetical protein